MAFFTSVKAQVPILGGEESEEEGGAAVVATSLLSSSSSTPRLEDKEEVLKEGTSTETVNTITGEEEACSSTNSTPTPNIQSERFSYDIDPELGAFV